MTQTKEKVSFRANPGAQEDFVKSQEPFPAFIGGFGAGKTIAGCLKAFGYTLSNPGAHGCITEPVSGMLADPLMETWRELFGEYEGNLWVERGRLGPNWQIEFPALGSHILLRSAETPGRLIGFKVAWAWMDEAAETEGGSQESAFLNLVPRRRQAGFGHWLGITTTSAGRDWLWRDWEDDPKKGHVLFKATSYDNPYLDKASLAETVSEYGEGTPLYRQRIMAEFAQLEGLVLPTFDPQTMIKPWPDTVFLSSIAGVDFAPQSPTTVVESSIDLSGRRWLREWLYERECDNETLFKACRAAMRAGVTLFVGDPSGKEQIRDMNRERIPTIAAPSNKILDRVKAWTKPIGENRLMVDKSSQFLIREVTGLTWAKKRGRLLETNEFSPLTPDHAVDAGAYALMQQNKMIIDWKPPEIGNW